MSTTRSLRPCSTICQTYTAKKALYSCFIVTCIFKSTLELITFIVEKPVSEQIFLERRVWPYGIYLLE